MKNTDLRLKKKKQIQKQIQKQKQNNKKKTPKKELKTNLQVKHDLEKGACRIAFLIAFQ